MTHELLAPAGSLDICKEVLRAGADAVYLGGEKYGARAFAKNFSHEDIFEALDIAHLKEKKIFLTVNTLLKNKESGAELFDYLKPLYQHGLDAIIVQDYGVFQFVRNHFPDLAIHCSTQMSVANVSGAAFLQQQGASRIVTARELSLEEIRAIYDATGVEIESFIHGALCYCYSGQCLMSSILGGRSGNRGRCAQPCRLSYQVVDERGQVLHRKEKFPLSPRDLCTVELLPEICEAGVYSFKIEGRMKQLEYAAGVTRVYRHYLDLYEADPGHYKVSEKDLNTLLQLGNRNGFTKGYYVMRNGREMMTLTDSSHASGTAREAYVPAAEEKCPVDGQAFIQTGAPMELSLTACGQTVHVTGAEVLEASSRPLERADVSKRLEKTGDTPFVFRKLSLELGENCFVPVKQLNELRRTAFEQLQERILQGTRRFCALTEPLGEWGQSAKSEKPDHTPTLNVFVSTAEQLKEVLNSEAVDQVTVESILFAQDTRRFGQRLQEVCAQIHAAGKKAAFCFPYIFRANSEKWYQDPVVFQALNTFDRIWVRSYDSLGFAKQAAGIPAEKLALEHNLYVYSDDARRAFALSGVQNYTASLELNQKELAHMDQKHAEMILYGYLPMMISAQCVYKNYDTCDQGKHGKQLSLIDRYEKQFAVKRSCMDCYNIISNSQPLYLIHQNQKLKGMSFASYRCAFTCEDAAAVRKILTQYETAICQGLPVDAPGDAFTNGHFRRGVD